MSAYIVNPPRNGEPVGRPSVGFAYVDLGHGQDLEALTLTESPLSRLELGYGFNNFNLGINGSARQNGNTALLINHVFSVLQAEGIETELVQLGGHAIRGCAGCNACMKLQNGRCSITGDPVNDIIAKMAEADGIILGSPVYFTDVTPELKALIDRSGRVARANGLLFKRKVGAGVIAVRRGGATHALDTIYHFLHITQMIIPGAPYWNFGIGRDVGDVEKDEEGIANMKGLGENIAWLLKKLHA